MRSTNGLYRVRAPASNCFTYYFSDSILNHFQNPAGSCTKRARVRAIDRSSRRASSTVGSGSYYSHIRPALKHFLKTTLPHAGYIIHASYFEVVQKWPCSHTSTDIWIFRLATLK